MKNLGILLITMALALFSYSQSYNRAIGLKGGNVGGGVIGGAGINYKQFAGSGTAFEATLGLGDNHFNFQLLFEWQKPLIVSAGLDWYVGLGGTVGAWRTNWNNSNHDYDEGFYLGGNGVIGLDWNLEKVLGAPIGLALDVGPSIGVINSRFWGWGGGFALRYIID